ncbi:MAG TPA: transglycosylase SLT domain-containing protein [Xanthobacteraceae bacterium]|nr:transglycosylase SLT domain-containing protein [Xanthobacteraceae bacterium]
MLVDPSNSSALAGVASAIRQASQSTGASFNYLLATAQVESGLNPNAGAATSSARGLFQFIEQTWLATIKQAGSALGYSRYADAISQTAPGKYEVSDSSLRREILKLRGDPTANAVMAGAFTKSNADVLSQRLGRAPSEGELYIAHFLGVGGAARLISLAASNPTARASHFFSHAAAANSSIFYDRSGAPRSVAQVRDILTARYDVARNSQGGSTAVAQAMAAPAAASAPDTAGIANAFAAGQQAPVNGSGVAEKVAALAPAAAQSDRSQRQVFRGLFADASASGPLAPLVSALWGVPNGNAALGSRAVPGGLLNLFRDPVAKDT